VFAESLGPALSFSFFSSLILVSASNTSSLSPAADASPFPTVYFPGSIQKSRNKQISDYLTECLTQSDQQTLLGGFAIPGQVIHRATKTTTSTYFGRRTKFMSELRRKKASKASVVLYHQDRGRFCSLHTLTPGVQSCHTQSTLQTRMTCLRWCNSASCGQRPHSDNTCQTATHQLPCKSSASDQAFCT